MWDAVQRHPRTSALYMSFFLGCVAFWKLLQFRTAALDWVLTLSASLQSLGFALLVVEAGGGCGEGLSEKSLWAFFIAHVARLSTTMWGPGYTPEDNSSDVYLYQILELLGVLLLGFYLLKLGSMRSMRDVGQTFERWSVLSGMVGVSMVTAYLTKSTGHNDWFADFSWMFSVWLEALALGPQVMLLCSCVTQVEEGAMHFVSLSLLASLAFGYFWSRSAWDQYAEFQKEGAHVFYWGILACAAIRVTLCVTFLHLFMKQRGRKGHTGVDDVFADDMI
jgi:hypothetical protein